MKFPIGFDLILRAKFYAMPELRFDGGLQGFGTSMGCE